MAESDVAEPDFFVLSWHDLRYYVTIFLVLLWCFGWAYAARVMMARTTLTRHVIAQDFKQEMAGLRAAGEKKQR